MAVREVIRMGHPLLREKASAVDVQEIQSSEMQDLIKDMLETMKAQQGIGLAAPQIAVAKQIAIIGIEEQDPRDSDSEELDLIIMFNPKITVLDEEQQEFLELAKEFAIEEVYSQRDEIEKYNLDLLRSLMLKSGEIGFLGIDVPEEYGGLALDKITSISALDKFV